MSFEKFIPTIIFFDIVGFCNANCSYCPSGTNKLKNTFIDVGLFENVILHLTQNNLIPKTRKIHLYNWTESSLHPQFEEIILILKKYNIKARISTNCIKKINLSDEALKNIAGIRISISGITNETYKRIYGSDSSKVLKNIVDLVNRYKKLDYAPVPFEVHYLEYKFNTHELEDAKNYFKEIGVGFSSGKAYVMDMFEMYGYLDNTLDIAKKDKIDDEIYVDSMLSSLAKNRALNSDFCEQFKFISINEKAELLACCAVPSYHKDYSLGNILQLSKEEIYKRRIHMPVCKKCFEVGAFTVEHS